MPHRRAILVLVSAAAAASSAGACAPAPIDPIRVALGCPEAPLRGPDQFADEPADRLIDDFEGTAPQLPAVGGRNGAWIVGKDSSGGTLVAETSSTCAARGGHAGHFAGKGFTTWGSNWTAVFKNNNGGTAVPYDGHNYNSISFWAAYGAEAMPPYEVPLGLTTMDNAWNSGNCSTCMDYYASSVKLTSTWQRFDVQLSDMVQGGWGVPQVSMNREQLVGFIMWPTHQFDIWIDDVRFEP
jgi:hypothetical protein